MSWHTKQGVAPQLVPLTRPLRRARLLAARGYPPSGIARRGILSGQWDGGEVVRRHLVEGEDQSNVK